MIEPLVLGAVLAVALVLFWTRWTNPEITALLVLLALVMPWPRPDGRWAPILTPEEGFAAFGSPAVVMVASLFVLGAAIVRTGAASALGTRLLRAWAGREWTLQLAILLVSALTSMILNDTTVVLILLPVVVATCRERGLPPGRYLIFAAYGSLLGGQWTLIGTRSNILLSDFLREHEGRGLAFFAFAPMAAVVLALASAWMVTLGRRSLPTEPADPLADPGALREYLSEARITPRSPMIGLRIDEVDWAGREDLAVVQVLRRGRALPPWAPLEEGDELVLEGGPSAIADVLRSSAAEMTKEIELDATTLQSVDLVCVEVFLATESRYLGQTLRALDFRHSHGFTVLALSRGGRRLRRGPMRTRLRLGDSLLLVGSSEALPRLGADPDLVVVSGRPVPALGRRKALVVALLLAGVVLLALSDALGPVVTLPLAAVLAVLLGCIRPRDARDAIDWSTVITIAALLPFGTALEKTGAAKGLAHLLVGATAGAGPVVALAAVLLVGLALTQVIDNAAVAIVVAPIAYRVATELGVEPTPFFVGLGLCTSAAFCTPFAHESTLLVSNAGGYHFRHFLRAGWALAIVTWLVATALTPLVWPLRAG